MSWTPLQDWLQQCNPCAAQVCKLVQNRGAASDAHSPTHTSAGSASRSIAGAQCGRSISATRPHRYNREGARCTNHYRGAQPHVTPRRTRPKSLPSRLTRHLKNCHIPDQWLAASCALYSCRRPWSCDGKSRARHTWSPLDTFYGDSPYSQPDTRTSGHTLSPLDTFYGTAHTVRKVTVTLLIVSGTRKCKCDHVLVRARAQTQTQTQTSTLHIHIHLPLYLYLYLYIHTHRYLYVHIQIHQYLYVQKIHSPTQTQTHTSTSTHICVHKYTETCAVLSHTENEERAINLSVFNVLRPGSVFRQVNSRYPRISPVTIKHECPVAHKPTKWATRPVLLCHAGVCIKKA